MVHYPHVQKNMMNQVYKNNLLLFAIAIFSFFGSYLLSAYLARHLSIYVYADYNIAIKFLDLVVTLILFGSDTGSVCYLSKYLLNHQKQSIQDYIVWNVKLVGCS